MRRISKNVIMLGNNFFNFYLVGGRDAALVECGTQAGAMIFAEQWMKLGERPDIKYIILLHSHFDHVCGLPLLKNLFPHARVVAGGLTKKLLAQEKLVQDLFRNDWTVTNIYFKNGFIEEKPPRLSCKSVEVDLVVEDGDVLQLGDLKLSLINAPGHSKCSMAAYLEPDQCLFVSDATGYRFKDNSVSASFFSSYSDYIDTIKKFCSYPVRAVAPAHGRIAYGQEAAGYLEHGLHESQKAFEYIRQQITQGADDEELIKDLFACFIKEGLTYFPADLMRKAILSRIKCVKSEIGYDQFRT